MNKVTQARDAIPATTADIAAIRQQAAELISVEQRCEDLKRELDTADKRRKKLVHEILPEMMGSAQVTSIGVGNVVVSIEPEVKAKLPVDPKRRDEVVRWLDDHGHGGIVDRELQVNMPDATTESMVVAAVDELANKIGVRLDPKIVPTVNYQTYLATMRQLLRDDVPDLPLEMLGVHILRMAVVERPDKDSYKQRALARVAIPDSDVGVGGKPPQTARRNRRASSKG